MDTQKSEILDIIDREFFARYPLTVSKSDIFKYYFDKYEYVGKWYMVEADYTFWE